MIEIKRTSEMRQLEEGGWKAAIHFTDDCAETFLNMKRRALDTNSKLYLFLSDHQLHDNDNIGISHQDALHYASILDGVSKALKRETEVKTDIFQEGELINAE